MFTWSVRASNSGADRFIGVSSRLMSWTEAQTYCRTFHTDLASALNQSDNDLLRQVVYDQGRSWFGLFRDTWKWSDGTIPTSLLWDLGQPNNYYKDEDCGDFYKGSLTDRDCTELYYFICHTPAASNPAVRHTYHAVMAKVSWTDAQSYCRVMYSDLATIVTNNDWMRLKKELASNNLTSLAWIGLYSDPDSWRWSLNDLENTVLQKWRPHEPNNEGGNQSCVMIDAQGYWYDEPCADSKPFICYSAVNTGAGRFVAVSSPLMSWTEAQTYCRTFHTDLASALNQEDNNLLQQVASAQGSSWIGLFRDTWKWSDGTIPADLQWSSGQPNNYYKDEDCGAVYNKAFSDDVCSNLYYFICHSFPPMWERKTVRLQVKSDGSVLDPAVQSSILEQLKQKVKDHSMLMEASVSWRVQKDGKIFHTKNKNKP
ncbi:hypothetical protein QTP70_034887 [Hemibagrus guttatus]|uniref:C-type lectin domain-containing protein n=1 Tax=Hemibagrus guttatus TaxID=175788 RepID=A0AAE0PTN6_9TELE|nr:hypothetical protein QTP70_034887 [Hemibagrus guttatus]